MGATGVVGGTIPIALGSALAAGLSGQDSVAVVFFGDGAVQAGHFNETVNLAALWQLPLILVCENNGFAEFTPRSAHTVVERVSDVVAPYGIERATVDGNDVLAVREAFGTYLASARAGTGPFLLECLVERLRGHYEGDPGKYREAIAAEDWQRAGPDPAAAAARRRAGLVRRGCAGRRSSREAAAAVEAGGAVRPREPVPGGRPDRPDGLRRWLRRRTSRRSPCARRRHASRRPRVRARRGRRRGRALHGHRRPGRGVRHRHA